MAVGARVKTQHKKPLKMITKRKRHEAAFKARVALEALKGGKTIQQIAGEYGVHPVQVSDWKKTLQERMAGVFERNTQAGAPEGFEEERAELHAKIGELTVKVDFLTKKTKQLGL